MRESFEKMYNFTLYSTQSLSHIPLGRIHISDVYTL